MSKESKELYEFGPFRLDVDEHTLTRSDEEKIAQLPEKAFQTLVILVRNSGHLLGKSELIDQIWPDSFVEENNLDKCIHAIRQVLGEKAGGQKYIETVRKHGYRFVGAVRSEGPANNGSIAVVPNDAAAVKGVSQPVISTTTTDSGTFVVSARWSDETQKKIAEIYGDEHDESPRAAERVRTGRRTKRVLAAIVLLAGISTVTAYFFAPRNTGTVEARTIAVLPLRPIDRANRNDLYEIGIADSLIHRLHAADRVVVRPLSAVRKFTDIDQDPLAAGRELKVDHVIESSYQIADGRIKVTSRFLNVATGKVDDTFTVSTDSADLFSAQEVIAIDLANRLLSRIGLGTAGPQVDRGTTNEDAYRVYLTAMNLSEERGVNNVRKALELLEQAVALDPKYARAWAGKALTHQDIVGHTNAGQHEHFPKAAEAIRNALAIDPDLSEAYSALCHNKNRYEYDAEGAEAACRRAVELDPNSPAAHRTYANFLYTRGRFDEALAEIKTAIDLQPISFRNQQTYALTLFFARQYPEAQAQFRRMIDLNPNHAFSHGRLALILQLQGKESEAFECLIKRLTLEGASKATLDRYKIAFRSQGWRGVWIEDIRALEADPDRDNWKLACLHARLGNNDKAFGHLERAFQDRSFLVATLRVEPALDSLRSDPRFSSLVERVEQK